MVFGFGSKKKVGKVSIEEPKPTAPEYHFYFQVNLPTEESERRNIISGLNGSTALVEDSHTGPAYMRGKICYDKKDPEIFYIEYFNGISGVIRKRVWLHDLEGLMAEDRIIR